MEILVSALVGDIVSRFISSLIKICRRPQRVEEKLQKLQQLLLRAHTIAEEARDRDITNERMLLQLKKLIAAMYRGYFIHDAFKYGALAEKATGDEEVRRSLALSGIMCLCKCQRFATSTVFGSGAVSELKSVLGYLESVLADVREVVILLGSYPRRFRQPYSTYLFVDTCMFGRQIERQRIINFLLQKENLSVPNLSVLPIIGAPGVGKKTLVEHACHDERVINYYSSIVRLNDNDLKNLMATTPKAECFPARKCLFIIEFRTDVDEAAWRKFYFFANSIASAGSKVIITSVTDKVSSFGMTQPLTLKFLSTEEYWYFFKVLAFGSSNADDHPRLASLAMEIAAELKESFLYGNIDGRRMRANFNAQFWYSILKSWRKTRQKNLLIFDENPMDLFVKGRPFYQNKIGTDQFYLFCNYYSTGSMCRELPEVDSVDLITMNNIRVEGELQTPRWWKSPIPPYHTYIGSCVWEKPRDIVRKRKRDG